MDQAVLTSRDIIGLIDNGIEASKNAAWPFLCGMEFGSNQETEKYKIVGATPALTEWIGSRSKKSLRTAGIDVTNKPYEATLILHKNDLRRDKTGFINMRISQMADRVNQFWAKLLSTIIEAGISTVCIDGKYFYAANHVWGDSGTWSNLLTYSDYGKLAVVDRDNPTSDEMAKAFLAVVKHFYSIKDDQGEPANEGAVQFMVQVPIALMDVAIEACASKFLSTGSGVRDNPLTNPDVQNIVKLIPAVNPRLTSNYAFYVHRIDGAAKGFILQDEMGPEYTQKAEGSDFEHDTNCHEYGVHVERSVAYAFPDKSIKATISTK